MDRYSAIDVCFLTNFNMRVYANKEKLYFCV